MLLPLLLTLPWLGLLAFMGLLVRLPRPLPTGAPTHTPSVTVVVPARNEAVNIQTCLGSLVASTYPDFEVVVVDDRSEDGTGDLARAVGTGNARKVTVVSGEAVPEGWLGKPWACAQGARVATGELLLFTDADTVHGPDLLARAVAGMEEDDADVMTVAGRQIMGSFWERLVQPQVFTTMAFRYFNAERSVARGRWRDAIANGQYLLFRRKAYDALGGHGAVKDEVVEDLAMAQHTVRSGRKLRLRMAEDAFATRMYRSLGELVAGWSKNILMGGLQSIHPKLRWLVAPTSVVTASILWFLPPVALVASLMDVGGSGLQAWAAGAVSLSIVFWMAVTARMGAAFWYGVLYPLGAAVGMYIFLRSWVRGRNVEWKGRAYVLRDLSERP